MQKTVFWLLIISLLCTACNLQLMATDLSGNSGSQYFGIVKQDTLCYSGPGPSFGTVVSLSENSQLKIVGASELGKYAVVEDPSRADGICWVSVGDIAINSETLVRDFLKLQLEEQPNSDENTTILSPSLVRLHQPRINCQNREPEEVISIVACHTAAEVDIYCTECGEWIFPANITGTDCGENSPCSTQTPLPGVFVTCTPVPPFADLGAADSDSSSEPDWSAASDDSYQSSTLLGPIILDLTLCWYGPGDGYEVVDSVYPNTPVEVLGTGQGGGYIVIFNERFNRPCWVQETVIDLNDFDITGMTVYEIPSLPTKREGQGGGNEESSSIGCMVSQGVSKPPVCTIPCPDPVAYPTSCTIP